MGTWRIKVVTGQKDPLAKNITQYSYTRIFYKWPIWPLAIMCIKVVVGQKDQLPKLKHERNTFYPPYSNGNQEPKNVPDL